MTFIPAAGARGTGLGKRLTIGDLRANRPLLEEELENFREAGTEKALCDQHRCIIRMIDEKILVASDGRHSAWWGPECLQRICSLKR